MRFLQKCYTTHAEIELEPRSTPQLMRCSQRGGAYTHAKGRTMCQRAMAELLWHTLLPLARATYNSDMCSNAIEIVLSCT